MDHEIQTALADVKNRKFVVFHPVFGYSTKDYDLEMYALEEDGKESIPQMMQAMIASAKEEDIKVVFFRLRFPPTNPSLCEGIGRGNHSVRALGRKLC